MCRLFLQPPKRVGAQQKGTLVSLFKSGTWQSFCIFDDNLSRTNIPKNGKIANGTEIKNSGYVSSGLRLVIVVVQMGTIGDPEDDHFQNA
jgi:hypothetical protein